MKTENKTMTGEQLAALIPNELIRLGLDAMKLIIADERYEIYQNNWHRPVDRGEDDPVICETCTAGSVMAMFMGCKIDKSYSPGFYDDKTLGNPIYAERPSYAPLHAINNFREGDVGTGFDHLGLPFDEGSKFNREMVQYGAHPGGFFRDMERLADDLEAAGH